MLRTLRRVMRTRAYLRGMGTRSRPEARLAELNSYVGKWVAVKDGQVVACAHNARELVPALHALGERGRGAVAQYVPYPNDAIMIGVG